MSFIGMIIIGFFVGLVARAILPGNNKMGFWLTSGLGILGSVVAGFLGQQLGWYTIGIYTDSNPAKTGVQESPWATNLGNIGQPPSVSEVFNAVQRCLQNKDLAE